MRKTTAVVALAISCGALALGGVSAASSGTAAASCKTRGYYISSRYVVSCSKAKRVLNAYLNYGGYGTWQCFQSASRGQLECQSGRSKGFFNTPRFVARR